MFIICGYYVESIMFMKYSGVLYSEHVCSECLCAAYGLLLSHLSSQILKSF